MESCSFCSEVEDIEVGSRVAIVREGDDESSFYDATVHKIKGFYYLVEFDLYEFDEERVEWWDRADLRLSSFHFIEETSETASEDETGSEDAYEETVDEDSDLNDDRSEGDAAFSTENEL